MEVSSACNPATRSSKPRRIRKFGLGPLPLRMARVDQERNAAPAKLVGETGARLISQHIGSGHRDAIQPLRPRTAHARAIRWMLPSE
jgi:hypothetical protein